MLIKSLKKCFSLEAIIYFKKHYVTIYDSVVLLVAIVEE